MRRVDLSLAYQFVPMSFVMVVGSGVLILGGPLTLAKVGGLTLIIGGSFSWLWVIDRTAPASAVIRQLS